MGGPGSVAGTHKERRKRNTWGRAHRPRKGEIMERAEFDEKFEELLKDTTDRLRSKADELWRSGGVDTSAEEYAGNYLLPKIIMSAALDYMKDQYAPHTWAGDARFRRAVKNLSYF